MNNKNCKSTTSMCGKKTIEIIKLLIITMIKVIMIIMIIIIIIITIIILSLRPGNTGLMSRGAQSHLIGRGILFSLGWKSFQRYWCGGTLNPTLVIMSESCLVMRQKLTMWMGPDSQSKDPHPAGVLDRGTVVLIL